MFSLPSFDFRRSRKRFRPEGCLLLGLSHNDKFLVELAEPTRKGDTGELGSVSARPRLVGYITADTGRGLPFALFPSLEQRRLAVCGISDKEILCIALNHEIACENCIKLGKDLGNGKVTLGSQPIISSKNDETRGPVRVNSNEQYCVETATSAAEVK